MTYTEKLQKLIDTYSDKVILLLRQFRIFENPTPQVLEDAYNKYGMKFQQRFIDIFREELKMSNFDMGDMGPQPIEYYYDESFNPSMWGSGTGKGWNWVNNILDLAGKGVGIWGQFQQGQNTGQDSGGYVQGPGQQPVIYGPQTGQNSNLNIMIIAAIALVIIVVLVVIIKK